MSGWVRGCEGRWESGMSGWVESVGKRVTRLTFATTGCVWARASDPMRGETSPNRGPLPLAKG